ncbi:uncharacterized protein [Dendrobates tinctorius]|uniref:uncharacterized protein n=1 Tax=Dendrobates tinctorius TaxID=92724 RepID=UPI003CCA005F
MPHKKRKSMAQMSADAKRKAALRAKEKCEDQEIRLTQMRIAAVPQEPMNFLRKGKSPKVSDDRYQYNIKVFLGQHQEDLCRHLKFKDRFTTQLAHCFRYKGEEPQFLQLFFMGNAEAEAQWRCFLIPNTRLDIVTILQQFLHSNNPYAQLFKIAIECMPNDDYKVVIRADKTTQAEHQRCFNAPTFDEVAILIGLKCKHLFHQFIVDMYAKIESEHLLYIRLNQKKLRAEEYIHLRDVVANDADPKELGKMVILPSTVTGSPRHMHEYTQDAMTYVRKYDGPDLFITFTCNRAWEEIEGHLLPGQKIVNHHDLIARVFKQKLSKMTNLITKSHIYGETQCWMYSVEWQKRGLPHAHILIWLKQKIQPTEIDNIISAELPDLQIDPFLFDTITKNLIHSPCGSLSKKSPCMIDCRCSKHYPRSLVQETQTGQDGYPVYRRRKPGDGGFTAKLKMHVGSSLQEIEIDNRWVVPYNPLLSKIFQAHINVESCHSVKYICKYVHKGSDQAVFELQKNGPIIDEVEAFQMGRYISSNEAV